MSEKWSGDGKFYLPARQVEPYRLWFEFLKQAHRDEHIEVDYEFYAEWGNFWDRSFSEWWAGETWRTLFAVDASVRVLDKSETIKNAGQAIIVRLPLGKDPKETLRDVQQLLEQHDAGTKLETVAQGRFHLSGGYEKGFLKYADRANFLLRLYRIWLDNAKYDKKNRIARTAVEFNKWAQQRTDLIEQNHYKYRTPVFPDAVKYYAEEFLTGRNTMESNERRQFMRYLKKARNLANNAARGEFPGKY